MAVTALLQDSTDSEIISSAYQNAHKLAGSLGMFGFGSASSLASQIEELLQVGVLLPQEQKLHLSKLVVALRSELQDTDSNSQGAEVKETNGHQNDVVEPTTIEAVTTELQQSHNTARVLIVDDDTNILKVLREILKPWGLEITTLQDPSQFWETLKATAPDLLVLDVEMPLKSGIELCQELRNNLEYDIPVLFLTAHSSPDIMRQVFAAGADDYVRKPIVEPEIVARILNRIERTRRLQNFAQIDPLTGLANRQKSTVEINKLLKEASHHNQPLCLSVLKIANLQQINHNYGHTIGDQVLSVMAKVIKDTFQSSIVCRWAGAEFILCLYRIELDDSKNLIFKCIRDITQKILNINKDKPVKVFISMGISQYSQDGTNLEALYHTAASRCKE